MNNNIKSIARITSETNTKSHYITMAGMHGCMPEYCEVYASESDAIDSLIDIHELDDSTHYANELRESGYTELDLHEHGNEYCKITSCDCDDPACHSEYGIDDYDLENFVDDDHALRVLENAIAADSPFWQKLADEIDQQKQDTEYAKRTMSSRKPVYAKIEGKGTVYEAVTMIYKNDSNYSQRIPDTFDLIIRFRNFRFNLKQNCAHEFANVPTYFDAVNWISAKYNDLVYTFNSIILDPTTPSLKSQLIDNKVVFSRYVDRDYSDELHSLQLKGFSF